MLFKRKKNNLNSSYSELLEEKDEKNETLKEVFIASITFLFAGIGISAGSGSTFFIALAIVGIILAIGFVISSFGS